MDASNPIPLPDVDPELGQAVVAEGDPVAHVLDAVKAKPTTQHTIASGQRPIAGRPRSTHRASPAPITPVAPQAAICHGVHGPWPKKKFEVSAASAPTANPGAPPRA